MPSFPRDEAGTHTPVPPMGQAVRLKADAQQPLTCLHQIAPTQGRVLEQALELARRPAPRKKLRQDQQWTSEQFGQRQ